MKFKYIVTMRGETFPEVFDGQALAVIVERMQKLCEEINAKPPAFAVVATVKNGEVIEPFESKILIFCCKECVLSGQEPMGSIVQIEDKGAAVHTN